MYFTITFLRYCAHAGQARAQNTARRRRRPHARAPNARTRLQIYRHVGRVARGHAAERRSPRRGRLHFSNGLLEHSYLLLKQAMGAPQLGQLRLF